MIYITTRICLSYRPKITSLEVSQPHPFAFDMDNRVDRIIHESMTSEP